MPAPSTRRSRTRIALPLAIAAAATAAHAQQPDPPLWREALERAAAARAATAQGGPSDAFESPAPGSYQMLRNRLPSLARVDEETPPVIREAAQQHAAYHDVRERVKRTLLGLQTAVDEMPAEPVLDPIREGERVRLLQQHLEQLLILGERILRNRDQFIEAVERFQMVKASAPPALRSASAYFAAEAQREEFEDVRKRYDLLALWFSLSAARIEQEARTLVEPPEFDREWRHLESSVAWVRKAVAVVRTHPFLLEGNDTPMMADMRAYIASFHKLGRLLEQWSEQILRAIVENERREQQPGAPPSPEPPSRSDPPAGTPAAAPIVVAGGPPATARDGENNSQLASFLRANGGGGASLLGGLSWALWTTMRRRRRRRRSI